MDFLKILLEIFFGIFIADSAHAELSHVSLKFLSVIKITVIFGAGKERL